MKHRTARTPTTALSPEPIAAHEERIEQAIRQWRSNHAGLLTAETSFAFFENDALLKLHLASAEFGAVLVRIARGGHPHADLALRRFIRAAIERDKLHELPVTIRAYAAEITGKAPLVRGYSSQAPQVIAHFVRDAVIVVLMKRVREIWPQQPLLRSNAKRRSAAALVGAAFGLGEKQAGRIYAADGGAFERFVEFICQPVRTFGGVPNVPDITDHAPTV
jgi:hypothetical protein